MGRTSGLESYQDLFGKIRSEKTLMTAKRSFLVLCLKIFYFFILFFENCIASLAVDAPEQVEEELASTSLHHEQTRLPTIEIVQAKGFLDIPEKLRHGPILLSGIWEVMERHLRLEMPYTLLRLLPEDFLFREIAFGIISLASGFTGELRLENSVRTFHPHYEHWWALRSNAQNQHRRMIVSELGIGYHKEGVEPGSAPSASTYWFRGVLIQLEKDLRSAENTDWAISKAIRFGKASIHSKRPFDILLISIEYIVILRVSGSSIQRTNVLPLLHIPIHYTKHPLERYIEEEQKLIEKSPDPSPDELTHEDVEAEVSESHEHINQQDEDGDESHEKVESYEQEEARFIWGR